MKPFEGLVALGKREDLQIRPVLLRALTDMFISRPSHTPGEIKQFETIVLGLLDYADDQTHQIIAAKLAQFGATPASIVTRFLKQGGKAGAEFLAHSSLVDRDVLRKAAQEGETAIAIAIAGRADLDADLARALGKRPETEVARALAMNFASPIDDALLGELAVRQPRDAALARALCQRASSPALIASLFLYASPSQRASIILAARRADLVSAARTTRMFAGEPIIAEIERAAIEGDIPLFEAILARGLGASLVEACEIVHDPHGEPLALALAALQTPAPLAARIFMRMDPVIAESVDRVRALTKLVDEITPTAARALASSMLAPLAERKRPVHRPVVDPTAAATPGRAAIQATEPGRPERRNLLLLRRLA